MSYHVISFVKSTQVFFYLNLKFFEKIVNYGKCSEILKYIYIYNTI